MTRLDRTGGHAQVPRVKTIGLSKPAFPCAMASGDQRMADEGRAHDRSLFSAQSSSSRRSRGNLRDALVG
jgi:hypothetical protein